MFFRDAYDFFPRGGGGGQRMGFIFPCGENKMHFMTR